jgi:hypothetical protein
MDIVAEMSAAGFEKQLVKIGFTCVTEGCMAYIVTEGYSFDKLEIKAESFADCTGNT